MTVHIRAVARDSGAPAGLESSTHHIVVRVKSDLNYPTRRSKFHEPTGMMPIHDTRAICVAMVAFNQIFFFDTFEVNTLKHLHIVIPFFEIEARKADSHWVAAARDDPRAVFKEAVRCVRRIRLEGAKGAFRKSSGSVTHLRDKKLKDIPESKFEGQIWLVQIVNWQK